MRRGYTQAFLIALDYLPTLNSIRSAIISEQISLETGKKIIDAAMHFGATIDQVNFLIQLAQQNPSVDFLTTLIVNYGFEACAPDPNNVPISVNQPACKSIFKFNTFTLSLNPTWTIRAAVLGNVYLEFNYQNQTKCVVIKCIAMDVTRRSNTGSSTCLDDSDIVAANALNNAVLLTQTDVNNFPGGLDDTQFYTMVRTRINTNLSIASSDITGLMGCGSDNTSYGSIYNSTQIGGAIYGQNVSTNCALLMADCQ